MDQKSLANWIKGIILAIASCGALIYFWIIPTLGDDLAVTYDMQGNYWPWLIFIWLTAIPCYWILGLVWRIAEEVASDNSFSLVNARYLKYIMILALGDGAYFFAGNVLFMLLGINHPGIMILSIFICIGAITIGVAAAVLSHLVEKAALLKEENAAFI